MRCPEGAAFEDARRPVSDVNTTGPGWWCRVRLLVERVVHLFAVAMVGGDQHFAAIGKHGFHAAVDAAVKRFDRADGGGQAAGVSDHVPVGVVANDGLILPAVDGFDNAAGHFFRTHFRLQVGWRPWEMVRGCGLRPGRRLRRH